MKLIEYFKITLLTFISPWLYGYYFDVIDHHHYLPYLNKILNPDLYPNDYFFSQPHGLYSPFNNVIIFITRFFNLGFDWIYFFLYLISLWILYYSVYLLAKTLYRQSGVALLAVFFFIMPKWAAQIGYMTHQAYFVSRDLSLGISLLALASLLGKKSLVSFFLIILAMFINPSIPIPLAIIWIVNRLPQISRFLTFGFFDVMPDNSWLSIMRRRGTYSFPHLWTFKGWGNLVFYLSFIGIAKIILKRKFFGRYSLSIKRFLFIYSILFIFHFIISAIYPIPSLIQLQLLRSLNFIFVIALISMAAVVEVCLRHSHFLVRLAALVALISLFSWGDHLTPYHILAVWLLPVIYLFFPGHFSKPSQSKPIIGVISGTLIVFLIYKLIIIKPQLSMPDFIYYPNASINIDHYLTWHDVQTWAKLNTPIDAVFAVSPNSAGFRSFSERGIIADTKDGGAVFYSPEYAQNCHARIRALDNYQNFKEVDFIKLQERYYFDYLVVDKSQALSFELVYQNQDFLIYKM